MFEGLSCSEVEAEFASQGFFDEVSLNPRKVEIRLPGKGDSNSLGARPVY